MIDFYSRTDLIDQAVTAEQALRTDGSHQHTAELATITDKIATTEAAIDRYLTAFENGTLDESACGHRIRDLAIKLDQLKARQDELAQLMHHAPDPPDPAAIEHLRRHLTDVLTHGTPGQRKAIIETHIAEIKIDGTRLIPIFMIPTGDDNGSADTSTDPEFRTMVRVVDRTWQNQNHVSAVQGPVVTVTPVRQRSP